MDPKVTEGFNKWADYWRFTVGANVVPNFSMKKKPLVEWKLWQSKPIPQELHDQWKAEGQFNLGLALVCGPAYDFNQPETPQSGFILAVDCDNEKSVKWAKVNLPWDTLQEHHNDPAKLHLFYKTDEQFKNVKPGEGKVEVKAFRCVITVTPSLHKSGQYYQFLNQNVVKTLKEVPDFFGEKIVEGGRNNAFHLECVRVIRKHSSLSKESLWKEMEEWNEKHCVPPLGKGPNDEDKEEALKAFNSAYQFVQENPSETGNEEEEEEIPIKLTPELTREVTFADISNVLETTIKKDNSTKLITFSAFLLAQTESNQLNIALQAESSTGKSYIGLEVGSYFPSKEVVKFAGASPQSFFHDKGVWDEETQTNLVNLENKTLVFVDMPHYQLLEKLRPFFSHDQKELTWKITDKSKGGANRTKTIKVRGFSSVIFCSASIDPDEQEKTRFILLSPDVDKEKLEETLKLIAEKAGDPDAFNKRLKEDPGRSWLVERILAIRQEKVKEIDIPNSLLVLEKFKEKHEFLIPRHQRDFKRIYDIIKAHALLNCFNRDKKNDKTILATEADIEAGLELYEAISDSNELGLSPHVWKIYNEVIIPLCSVAEVTKKDIEIKHQEILHKQIQPQILKKMLEQLEVAGKIELLPDPEDRRRVLVRLLTTKKDQEKFDAENEVDVRKVIGRTGDMMYNLLLTEICVKYPKVTPKQSAEIVHKLKEDGLLVEGNAHGSLKWHK